MLWWMIVQVNWLTLYQECAGQCFGHVIVPPAHFRAFSILENKLIGYADDSTVLSTVFCVVYIDTVSIKSITGSHVVVDGCRSKLDNIVSAVPQGSGFGHIIVPPIHLGPFFHSGE